MLFVLLLGLVSLQQADRVLGDDQLQVGGRLTHLPQLFFKHKYPGHFLKVSKIKSFFC
jgi:hypothetical protein